MSFGDEFTFLEKPASRDERIIGDLMKTYFDALRNRDLSVLLPLFSEDALIDSKAAGGIVSRENYAKAVEKSLPTMTPIHITELRITVKDASADVYGISSYGFKGRPGKRWLRKWKFEKRDGVWLIVESRYYPLG